MDAGASQNIYAQKFLQSLFDEMQSTYECVSNFCSFGFNRRWRKQLIDLMEIHGGHVCDFMTGTGETWIYLLPKVGVSGWLTAVDFSPQMVLNAEKRKNEHGYRNLNILSEDVLENSLGDNSVDTIICAYGVKTLSAENQIRFVKQANRLLKKNGVCGLVEISLPPFPLLKTPYFNYLKYAVPLIGKAFLGNPDTYRLLSAYLAGFKNCSRLKEVFSANGFSVNYHSFFFGCATAIIAKKV